MSRLSRAFKRLKGKPKQTKDESAPAMSSATEVATSQPLQCNQKPSLGAYKSFPTQLPAQGSHGLSGETRRAGPPCEPVLQSTEAVPSARKFSRPVSTFTEAALPPEPLIESPKEAAQRLSSGKAPAVNSRPQPAPKPTVTAPKANPQPTPRATRQTPKPKSGSVLTPRPTVQTHAGLYSGFTPSVAAVDQPHPKTLHEAQKTALDVLHGASPSGPGVPKTRRQYTSPGSSTMSSRPSYPAGFPNISYTSPSPYSPAGPLGTFRTGGPLGGGQYSGTGGAIGGGAIAQTGGRFGEGSVSKTGGSLGEAWGAQGRGELEEFTTVFGANVDSGRRRLYG
ncbi:hypothetical protein FGG08_000227 [Glutinoglossum americanum]|uniref:Uncharacterized protein n=1 Tax=Glutinoglossum americanum TaxID=1670608 RepID=A0A9P8IGX8_9PEZI|nr:hypothetical protein FGG08_000227 [Glutinoglossum americanum]